ncbi:helix-turn-helix domain-containing protein [Kibdelosporangium phytohabitans]|uniref:HTH cro/C1-type domain-containing protein n=1 Tax=Kibdelosporangium phytohabitans TaxID=860235 RepID=A0A0N9HQ58_9PSEU|nr:helix-turn-helix transcriptional regulator [Kibdelosporangium phytohabitans]ALG06812.1 hypothetical protein AOZ06_07620 [Kibdelosporangium phytohabitans]MBE1468054.1 transcriptional regulator with XRE-family HTH domain [Kibdelosporangium phytohabitans]
MRTRKMDGRKLREVRERRGLVAEELAVLVTEQLGNEESVSASTIWKIETGTRQPSGRVFAAICRVFEIKDDEQLLLPVEPEQVPA